MSKAALPIADLFPSDIPADNFRSAAFRIAMVLGDGMEPTLRGSHDHVLLKPCETYEE